MKNAKVWLKGKATNTKENWSLSKVNWKLLIFKLIILSVKSRIRIENYDKYGISRDIILPKKFEFPLRFFSLYANDSEKSLPYSVLEKELALINR